MMFDQDEMKNRTVNIVSLAVVSALLIFLAGCAEMQVERNPAGERETGKGFETETVSLPSAENGGERYAVCIGICA